MDPYNSNDRQGFVDRLSFLKSQIEQTAHEDQQYSHFFKLNQKSQFKKQSTGNIFLNKKISTSRGTEPLQKNQESDKFIEKRISQVTSHDFSDMPRRSLKEFFRTDRYDDVANNDLDFSNENPLSDCSGHSDMEMETPFKLAEDKLQMSPEHQDDDKKSTVLSGRRRSKKSLLDLKFGSAPKAIDTYAGSSGRKQTNREIIDELVQISDDLCQKLKDMELDLNKEKTQNLELVIKYEKYLNEFGEISEVQERIEMLSKQLDQCETYINDKEITIFELKQKLQNKEIDFKQMEIKASGFEKKLYDQKVSYDRLIDKYQKDILAFEELIESNSQTQEGHQQIRNLTLELGEKTELVTFQEQQIFSKQEEIEKLMDFVQELNDNIEFLENENENLRVNLSDLENDNRELLQKNFRASLLQQSKEHFAPKSPQVQVENSLEDQEQGSLQDYSQQDVDVIEMASELSKNSRVSRIQNLLKNKNSDFAVKVKEIQETRLCEDDGVLLPSFARSQILNDNIWEKSPRKGEFFMTHYLESESPQFDFRGTFSQKDLQLDIEKLQSQKNLSDDRQIYLKALEQNIDEYEFFNCIVLSIKVSTPEIELTDSLLRQDPSLMYQKATSEGVHFYQFYEWITQYFFKLKYNLDENECFLPTPRGSFRKKKIFDITSCDNTISNKDFIESHLDDTSYRVLHNFGSCSSKSNVPRINFSQKLSQRHKRHRSTDVNCLTQRSHITERSTEDEPIMPSSRLEPENTEKCQIF